MYSAALDRRPLIQTWEINGGNKDFWEQIIAVDYYIDKYHSAGKCDRGNLINPADATPTQGGWWGSGGTKEPTESKFKPRSYSGFSHYVLFCS